MHIVAEVIARTGSSEVRMNCPVAMLKSELQADEKCYLPLLYSRARKMVAHL